jgi:autotransporter-associated beta strand protein
VKKYLLIGILAGLGIGTIVWHHSLNAADGQAPTTPPASVETSKTNAAGSTNRPIQSAFANTNLPISREMDLTVNPYAGGLSMPGKSKRPWDASFIGQFQQAQAGDPVRFELTAGVGAEGLVKTIQMAEGKVTYVAGELTIPESGKFFLLTPPVSGKAGKAVGVMEFPASKTAYRIEPTGPNGDPELWQRRLDEVLCVDMPKAEQAATITNETANIPPLRPDLVPDYVPSYNSNVVSLQSYPGSPAVLLLDFFGGYTPTWGGVTYVAPASANNTTIKDLWKRVAEDFMPFNINVTTDLRVYQAAPAASRQRCCFTDTPITAAGVAYFGSWNWGNDTPCWSVYAIGKPGAEVGAHEPGHTLGLAHQTQDIPNGTNTTHNEYYGGQGSGAVGWAPIMGVGYYQPVSTWAKGEYQFAGNTSDALLTITTANNNVGYRPDDTGNTLATSRYLEVYSNNTASAEGVIEQKGDTDAFQFTTTGGAVSLTANPVGDWSDLAVMATLADATDTIIASNSPQTVLTATITTNLPAGTYTFRVTGAGRNDPLTNGFSNYASLGYYSITGSVAGARLPTRLSVMEHATNNTVAGSVTANNPNSNPLVYAITAGNTGGTFSVDSNGVVRVSNNALLDYNKLATSTMYAVQLELFMNITNLNDPTLTELNRRVVIAVQQVAPLVPTALTARANTSLRINLAWIGSFGASNFNVKRSTVHGGSYTTVASPSDANYTDGGLTNGVTYYYVVSAVNTNGESANSLEATATVQAIPNFGFEAPNIGSGNFSYNPSGGFWTFSGSSGNGSGIVANGSGFSNPNAPEGIQAAFVQSNGVVSQVLSGFTPGATYTITYAAAQRPGSNGGESWNVLIDGAVIQTNSPGGTSYVDYTATFSATAATHMLSFAGTDLAGGDNTVFLDNVRIGIVLSSVANASFELPVLGAGNFQYSPAGASWTFTGANPSGAGIVANGSGFGNPNAPDGVQAAFIQEFGTISKTISGLVPGGTYAINYSAAQRSGPNQHGGESWNVKIDNAVIQSNNPGGTSYGEYTATFVATATTQTLSFVGTDLAGGDNTVFLDNVSIISTLKPVTPAVSLTLPTNNAVFVIPGTVNLAAAVAANGNVIDRVQFYSYPGTFIGETTNAPYTYAWTNISMGGKNYSVFARAIFNDSSSVDSAPVGFATINYNPDFGFELPGIGPGNNQYNPKNAYWTFSGGSGNGSGIVANGSAFGNPNAPEGTQAAFVQGYGVIAQIFSGFSPGTNYTITYSAAQRSSVQNGGESWNVMIDNQVIETNNPGGASYTTYTATFVASAVTHTLSFAGTDLAGGDNTVFIDRVTINPPITAPLVVTNTLPVTATDVVGSQVSFTAGFNGLGPIAYQWQVISGGITNNIPGATNTILTLPSLQLSNTASYQLQASNLLGVTVSTPSSLTVRGVPVAVNNVVTSIAAQTGLGNGTTFTPTWTVTTNNSLIAGQSPSSTSGNFSLEISGRSVNSLTAGGSGALAIISGPSGVTTSTNYVTCGNGGGAGASVIYTLAGSATGYNLTNIIVHGGWADAGRDQQAYTVYYSTIAAPTTFLQLSTVNHNPANAGNVQSAVRTTLMPASGALAANVAAVKFDFTSPPVENGYSGYSGIQLFGIPAPPSVKWALANGNWDTTTLNWRPLSGGSTVRYVENALAAFDDSATGGSFITVTLTGNRSPSVITNNSIKNYTLAGNFAITGGHLIKNGGGTFTVDNGGTNNFSSVQINNGTLQVGNNDSNGSLGAVNVIDNGVLTFNRTDTLAFSNLISGSGSVVQNGTGTLALNAANTYTGNTTVTAGTLALVEPGSVGASALIAVANGTTLDVTGRADQTLTLNSAKSLKGSGSVKGNLVAQSGSIFNPGDMIGTMTVQGNITLNGLLVMELNRTNGQTADELVSTTGTITGGGTLTVTNLGPALQAGDTFQLFNRPVGGFVTVNLPSAGPGLGWANNLANNGTLAVVSTASPSLLTQIAGGDLTLTWPADHAGWRLQVQTNSITEGLGTNWWDLSGSTITNRMVIPINASAGDIFYRLSYP